MLNGAEVTLQQLLREKTGWFLDNVYMYRRYLHPVETAENLNFKCGDKANLAPRKDALPNCLIVVASVEMHFFLGNKHVTYLAVYLV